MRRSRVRRDPGISGHRARWELSVLPGNKLFAQVRSLAICTAGLGLGFICQENDSSGKGTHFPENSGPPKCHSIDTTFQSGCLPAAVSLFSLLDLFNTHLARPVSRAPLFTSKVCLHAHF